MKALFDKVSFKSSKLVTKSYSTSFSLGITFLSKEIRKPIYNIYGFVRFADEIVDTFHDYDKKKLLEEFRKDTILAISRGISLNPILNSFQETVNKYEIPWDLTETFLKSMEMDLEEEFHNQASYEDYILGSAEVVGLMCLHVFTNGDKELYAELEPYAMKLGAAFQKVNFLRDANADYLELGRTYFPGVDMSDFSRKEKKEIEQDIKNDFQHALKGIKKLPRSSRKGVYLAYFYYWKLFKKIQHTPANRILDKRIRIPNTKKIGLMFSSLVRHQLNLL